jgi:hypothetical protein
MPDTPIIEDPDHFIEGLVHLADMLELADPRRSQGQTQVAVPVRSLEEWRAFCLDVAAKLRNARDRARDEAQRVRLDETAGRLERIVQ